MEHLHGRTEDAAWGFVAKSEPRWPAALAILCAALLDFVLPRTLMLGPQWLFPLLEIAIVVPMFIASHERHGKMRRAACITLIGLVTFTNVVSLVLLIKHIIDGGQHGSAAQLFYTSIAIWLTNIIVFALWFWELDRGGPDARMNTDHDCPDFQFPQMITPACTCEPWTPGFWDYLYLAFTNAMAFSPADSFPLTASAKMLMLGEALASFGTIAIVAARAVGILN